MNFPFFVARRYLFSKKKTHAINVISLISVIGVAVATMALVIVLSVFNGFHDLVASFFTNFDPQLKVVPVEGKTVPADDPILTKISHFPEVDVATGTVEDMALAIYNGKQAMVTIKIYAPQREGQLDMTDPQSGFVVDSLISPGVVFSVNQGKYDKSYIVTSLGFAQNLFNQQGMLSALELRLKPGSNFESVKARMQQVAGKKYKVLDRFEQQSDTFKIMKVEKLMAYIFLTFILIVACFNIIGSLSMLIIDKKDDVVTLRNLGASDKQIRRIFLFEGRLISFFGAILGILLGLLLCWLQQQYGFVKMGSSDGTFVVNAYPVSVHYSDVLIIFFTVIAAGWLAVWYPVRALSKKLMQ